MIVHMGSIDAKLQVTCIICFVLQHGTTGNGIPTLLVVQQPSITR